MPRNAFERYVDSRIGLQERRLGSGTAAEAVTFQGLGAIGCTVLMQDSGEVVDDHGNTVTYSGRLRIREQAIGSASIGKGTFCTVRGTRRKVVHVQDVCGVRWMWLGDARK